MLQRKFRHIVSRNSSAALTVVLCLLLVPGLFLSRANAVTVQSVGSGYCVYVTPPPGVPWGGATICTP